MSGASGLIRQPPRRPPGRRYPPAVYWRRRLAVLLSLALLVAVIVGLVEVVGGGPPKTVSTTTTSRPTTSTGAPVTKTGVGMRTVVWTDTDTNAGLVVNPAPGGSAGPRKLVTEIWYPSVGGSKTTADCSRQARLRRRAFPRRRLRPRLRHPALDLRPAPHVLGERRLRRRGPAVP